MMFTSATRLDGSEGFVVLTATLVVMAVGVTIAATLLLLGIGSGRTSLSIEHSARAQHLANACAEYALAQLRLDDSYAGNESIAIGSESCFIETPGGSGDSDRGVQVYATVVGVTRRVEITGLGVTSTPSITRWEEVASYE